MISIPKRIRDKLEYYVHLYVDPRDNRIFYVGKGKDNTVKCMNTAGTLDIEKYNVWLALKNMSKEEYEMLRWAEPDSPFFIPD